MTDPTNETDAIAQSPDRGRLQHLVGVALARVDMKPREIIVIDGVFHDSDPLKSNLDLQCRDAKIKFTCL